MWNSECEPSDCKISEREVSKMYEFKAENEYDAAGAVQNWIASGVMPADRSYSIAENPDRPGYYIATEHM